MALLTAPIKDRLVAYRDAGEDGTGAKPWTLREIARQVGVNDGMISKYLSDDGYEGDVAALEARIEDVLRSAIKRRAAGDADLVDTVVSKQIEGVCESIRRSGDVGLIHSPAGLGKSCACRLYSARNPSSILVTVSRWSGSAGGFLSALWDTFDTRRWKGNVSRAAFIAERLSGSRRLLIVDNAHRLSVGALQYLFDLYDATGISIALVGNPEVLEVIKRSDQMFSRVGLVRAVSLGDAKTAARNARQLVDRMLEAYCGDCAASVSDLAGRIALEQGHFRALGKHLALADDMRRALSLDWRTAICEANKSLAVGYRL
jgi:DNA transposition AAA+ family ATPase